MNTDQNAMPEEESKSKKLIELERTENKLASVQSVIRPIPIGKLKEFNIACKKYAGVDIEKLSGEDAKKKLEKRKKHKLQPTSNEELILRLNENKGLFDLFKDKFLRLSETSEDYEYTDKFNEYLDYVNTYLAYIRMKEYGKIKRNGTSAKSASKSKKIKSLNFAEEIEYIEQLLSAFNNLQHISKIIDVSVEYSKDIEDKYYSYISEEYKCFTDENNAEKADTDSLKWVKLFIDIYPIPFVTGRPISLDEDEEKEYYSILYEDIALPKLKDLCSIIINQIHQLTFATRANYILEETNKKIAAFNKKNGMRIPKITQTSLNNKIKVNKETINNWFIGKTLPSTEFLLLFSKETNISVEYLLNPRIPISEIDYRMKTNAYIDKEVNLLGNESLYVLKFLFGKWANINLITTDQARLINMTINYLVRDLFVDDSGYGYIPTLNKVSVLNHRDKEEDQNNTKYTLTNPEQYYRQLMHLFKNGKLRFNKNSILYLIGRYMYDSDFSTPYINEFDVSNKVVVNGKDIHRLSNLCRIEAGNPIELKHAINCFFENMERLDDLNTNLEFSENIADYYLGKIIIAIENTLKEHHKNKTYPSNELKMGILTNSTTPEEIEAYIEESMYEDIPKQRITEDGKIQPIESLADLKQVIQAKKEEKKKRFKQYYKFLKKSGIKEIYLNDEAVFLAPYEKTDEHEYIENPQYVNGMKFSENKINQNDEKDSKSNSYIKEKEFFAKFENDELSLSDMVLIDDIAIPKQLIKEMYGEYKANGNKLVPDEYDKRKREVFKKYNNGFSVDYSAINYELERIDAERDGNLEEFNKYSKPPKKTNDSGNKE